MHDQPSKHFRWVGQPSEEELLGITVSMPRHRAPVSARAGQEPPPRPAVTAPSPPRRLRGRDILAVAAAAGVVALILGGAGGGFRFPSSGSAAPEASKELPGRIAVDHDDLGSLPRSASTPQQDRGGRTAEEQPRERGSNPREQDDPTPPGGGGAGGGGGGGGGEPADPPLLEANAPLVGTVTVDEPDLPAADSLPPAPEVPQADEVLPETPTVSLP